jgi:hypothetical protein
MTTEAEQFDYIQKKMDYTALNDASKVEWIPLEIKLTLERYAKVAEKLLRNN